MALPAMTGSKVAPLLQTDSRGAYIFRERLREFTE
jgi:hypothetical protein